MRNEVRVIWLEDSISGINKRPHQTRFEAVKEHIESKGYQPNITVVTDIKEAKRLLTIRGGEERYDFFISMLYETHSLSTHHATSENSFYNSLTTN